MYSALSKDCTWRGGGGLEYLLLHDAWTIKRDTTADGKWPAGQESQTGKQPK
jgi:hypothetical protein